tara:strand:- start:304 stop:582 length:279 start_codon:yes stop_codon:yes gene_type:complete
LRLSRKAKEAIKALREHQAKNPLQPLSFNELKYKCGGRLRKRTIGKLVGGGTIIVGREISWTPFWHPLQDCLIVYDIRDDDKIALSLEAASA